MTQSGYFMLSAQLVSSVVVSAIRISGFITMPAAVMNAIGVHTAVPLPDATGVTSKTQSAATAS